MSQEIKTVLTVDASKAVTGFSQSERAAAGYARTLTATVAKERASTNSLQGLGKAAASTGGSMQTLGSGMAASSAGMGKTANSLEGVSKAATASNVSIQALSSGGMKGLAAGTERTESILSRFSGSVRDNRSAWDDLSKGAMIGGAAIAGGMGLAAKAAIDWGSAWAGVAKTVDGTPEQMADLENGLRGLAKELPATHEELAGVAEAAGQLGVARKDILGFTETAVALGESTNLSAEEAATSLAKFSNIMGTAAREGVAGYEKLGSTLVALGNDGASTEQDIMQMSLRLAGAGKQIGATEADILAMANALSSVGIEAELGGGAMSRAMLQMNSAVIGGGDELEAFAEIAGMSATEFASAWREDPIAATNAFVGGLGRIGESGGDASAALDSVGLSGTQNAQVLLRAAGASDLMTESLKLGASAWDDNTALQDEARKRYETTASRMQIATNTMKDAAIDFGSVLGPILATGAEKVAGMANAFVQLPGPVKTSATALAGVAASTLLIGGATVKAIGWTQDLRASLDQIGIQTGPRTDKALRGVAKAGAGLAVFAGVRLIMGGLQDVLDEAVPSADQLALALDNLSKTGDLSEVNEGIERLDVKKSSASAVSINDMGEAVAFLSNQSSTDKTRDWVQGLVGMDSDVDRLTQFVSGLDKELTNVFEQDPSRARDMWATMVAETERAGGSVKDLEKQFPLLMAAMDNASATGMNGELAGITAQSEETEKAVDDLSSSISELGDGLLNQRGSVRDFHEALSEMRESLKENGSAYGVSTTAGRANMEALEGIAVSARDAAAATFEQTGSVEKAEAILAQGRREVDKYAGSLNGASGDAKLLKDEVLRLPPEAKTEFKAVGAEAAIGNAAKLGVQLGGIPPEKDVKISEYGSSDSAGRVAILNKMIGAVPLVTNAKVTESGAAPSAVRVNNMGTKIRDLKGKTVTVLEAGATASRDRVVKMDGAIFGLRGKQVSVTEIGSTASGARVVRFKGEIYTLNGKTVSVGADVFGGAQVGALIGQINQVQDKTATITVNRVTNTISRVFGGKWAGGIEEHRMAAGGVLGPGELKPGIYGTSTAGIHMAEDTRSKWEAYIPERMDLRARSLGILADVAGRMGHRVIPMAEGGTREHANRTYVAPPPPVMVQSPATQPAAASLSLSQRDVQRIATAVREGAYAGTAQQRKNQLAQAATTPRGRGRS